MHKDELDEKKRWLFQENLRLEEEKRTLEDERKLIEVQKRLLEKQQGKATLLRKQLENQKILFDKQWQILERETRRLAIDREHFERDKQIFRDVAMREARKGMTVSANIGLFFRGVNDMDSLKKRYRALQKIYHPDDINGDTTLIIAINEEYEKQKQYYIQ